MSGLENFKIQANNQIKKLIQQNIFKQDWDVKIITIPNHNFLYIDCDTSKVNINFVKELCRQHLTNDIKYKLAVLIN
tara:strand:- start:500 stop:730 length:231 start_codon:yes stop_codon:yes gene_type:complete